MTLSDAELLERWRQGDSAAGEMLFERYYDPIERFFLNKVSSSVADLVQETFVACVEGRERVADGDKFRSYLFSIAYNVLRGYWRRNARIKGDFDFDNVTIQTLSAGPSTLIAQRREQRLLLAALRGIPVNHQVILELHYWESLKTADIAVILDLPVGTVRSRMLRARALLEQEMTRLAASSDELKSTVSGLEDWAEQCRQGLSRFSPA